MRVVAASAPGKAVLVGEYAVLHGTPALVMAVDRRVHVRIWGCAPDQSRLHAPQIAAEAFAFRILEGGALDWLDRRAERPELALSRRLLERELGQLDRALLPPPGGLQVMIDSSELFESVDGAGIKLGLGSSAAVSVALSAALETYLGRGAQHGSPASLLESHRQNQGGRGSGVDLAAALLGGVLSYQLDGHAPRARSLSWPQGWPLLFVWSGQAAATGGFLEAYERWRLAQPVQWSELHRALDLCARAAAAAVESGALQDFMTCINNYGGLMGKIGSCIGAPVMSPRHQRLAAMAIERGAAYKPCGAGGGDLGMFVACDDGLLAQLGAHARAAGFRTLALAPALTGLQLTLSENTDGQP